MRKIFLLCVFFGVVLVAPVFAPYDPLQTVNGAERQLPSYTHLLGTDLLGRDVFSRLLTGGRNTLTMALLASLISTIPGILFGLILGWFSGWLDTLGSSVLDALLAFPGLLTVFVGVALFGSGHVQIALAVGISGIAPFVRLTRNAVRQAKTQPYILAAVSLGASDWRVMRDHLLPNIAAQVIGFAGITFSLALSNGAALAFLGFAGDPSVPEWGTMLAEGRQLLRVQPVLALAVGIALAFTVWAVNRTVSVLWH